MIVKSDSTKFKLLTRYMIETRDESGGMPFFATKSAIRKGLQIREVNYTTLHGHSQKEIKNALVADIASVYKNRDGSLEIGCQTFTSPEARKLKKWANSK